ALSTHWGPVRAVSPCSTRSCSLPRQWSARRPNPPVLEHALIGQLLDLGPRHTEQLAIDILVVLAIAGRTPVDTPTGMCRALRQLDRHCSNGPATDFAARHLGHPFERLQLWIDIAALLGCLADPSRHTGSLQGRHQLAGVATPRPLSYHRIERILIGQT